MAGDRRRRQHPAADDPARQRPPRHGRGLPRRASPAPAWPARRPAASPSGCSARCRSAACRASPRATSRSRTATPSAPPSCCWRRRSPPARASSTPAPRPAARPRTCSSWPISTCWRSTATRRGWPGSTPPWPASGWRPAPSPPTPPGPRPGGTAGRSRRSCSTRPAAPRASCAAIPTSAGCAGPSDIAGAGGDPGRACSTRSGRCWRRAAGCCTAPARCSRPRARTRSTLFCNDTATPSCLPRRLRPGTCCRCPTMTKRCRQRPSAAAADGFFLTLIEKHRDTTSFMTSPPPPGSLRRRSLLRALGAAALRVLPVWGAGAAFLAGAPSARASAAELTAFDLTRDEDGVYLSYAVDFELGAQRRRRPDQVGAAVLRRRGRDLPRPLVLARPPRRPRGARLADRLPAAHLDLPRDDDRRPEPDLRHPRRGDRRRSAGRRAGRSPSRGRSRRAAATTSSSVPARHLASCRGRCRSASAANPTGNFRSSARCASTESPLDADHGAPLPSRLGPSRPDPGIALGLGHLDRRRPRRRAGARLPAVDRDQQPGAVRAPLRLAVLGQRRPGEPAGLGDRRRRGAPALAGGARPLRQPAAAQAGGDLRPRRRRAGRADLHRQLPVRLALRSRAGSTSRSRARSTPASTSAAARSTRSSPTSAPRPGWPPSAWARRRARPSRSRSSGCASSSRRRRSAIVGSAGQSLLTTGSSPLRADARAAAAAAAAPGAARSGS